MEVAFQPSILYEQRIFNLHLKKCLRGRRAYTEAFNERRNFIPSSPIGTDDIRYKKTKTQKKEYNKKKTVRNQSSKSTSSLSSCASSADLQETRF